MKTAIFSIQPFYILLVILLSKQETVSRTFDYTPVILAQFFIIIIILLTLPRTTVASAGTYLMLLFIITFATADWTVPETATNKIFYSNLIEGYNSLSSLNITLAFFLFLKTLLGKKEVFHINNCNIDP